MIYLYLTRFRNKQQLRTGGHYLAVTIGSKLIGSWQWLVASCLVRLSSKQLANWLIVHSLQDSFELVHQCDFFSCKSITFISWLCSNTYHYPILGLFLVGGLDHFLFFHILGIIIPTDELIFFRGLESTLSTFSGEYICPIYLVVVGGSPLELWVMGTHIKNIQIIWNVNISDNWLLIIGSYIYISDIPSKRPERYQNLFIVAAANPYREETTGVDQVTSMG